MTALLLVLLSQKQLPIRSEDDFALRYAVAEAIELATEDPFERRVLMVTATEESHFRPEVLDCRVRGDQGRARGPYQVHPRSNEEREALCQSLEGSTLVALDRIRESMRACGKGPHGLSLYASGSCFRGTRISARRWALSRRESP